MAHKKILLVDDEEDILRSTKMLLSVMGYECVTVSDARKVEAVAAKEHPDLILQDLRMPTLELDRFMASLRSNPATADIPCAFFSASPTLPETAALHDATGYLTKPFREEELQDLLDRTLPARAVGAGVSS